MQNAFFFLFRTLADLYLIAFLLRFVLQRIRVDARNPLSQLILTVTNPVIIPLRRIIPAFGKLDTATLVAILLIGIACTAFMLGIACASRPEPIQILMGTVLHLAHMILNLYFFLIIAQVILSWVGGGGYNPAVAILASIVTPVLAPFQRILPPVGGFDLSPLFALIIIQFLMMLLPSGSLGSGLTCFNLG